MEDRGIDTGRLERNVVTHGVNMRSANSPYLLHVDKQSTLPMPSLPFFQLHKATTTSPRSRHFAPPFDSLNPLPRLYQFTHDPSVQTLSKRRPNHGCDVTMPLDERTNKPTHHHQPPTATYQPSYPRSTAMIAYVSYTQAIFTTRHITAQHITAPISTCPAVPSPTPAPAPHYAARGRRNHTDPNPNPDVETETEPVVPRPSDTNFAACSDSDSLERTCVSFATHDRMG